MKNTQCVLAVFILMSLSTAGIAQTDPEPPCSVSFTFDLTSTGVLMHLSGGVAGAEYAPNGVHLTIRANYPDQPSTTVGGTTCDFPASTCETTQFIDGCISAPTYTGSVAPCPTGSGVAQIHPVIDRQPTINKFDARSSSAKIDVTFPHQGSFGLLPRVRLNWAPSNDIAASGLGSNAPSFDSEGNLIQPYDHTDPPPAGTVGVFATAFSCDSQLIDFAYAPLPDKDTGCDGSSAANCNSCEKGCVGDPVRTSNGNVRYTETDPLPSNPAFRLIRIYDSKSPSAGLFGTHWTSPFDGRAYTINLGSGSTNDAHRAVFLRTERNQDAAFERSTSSQPYRQIWPRNQSAQGRLAFDGTSYIYQADGEGIIRTYDAASGLITGYRSVADDQGVTIAWQSGFPTTVTDSRGNWTLNITNDGTLITGVGVSGQPSLQWSYAYSAGLLLSVSDAGANTWRAYVYESTALLDQVLDARGATIESHQYDAAENGITSSGPSGEVTNVIYNPADRTPRTPDETITSVIYGSNYRADYYMRPIAGRLRVVTINGPCTSCDMNDVVDTYDDHGNVVREQDGRGYITLFTYDQTGSTLVTTSGPWKPSSCDPAIDSLQCRMTPDDLATATFAATTSTKTTSYAYVDPNWPSRATHIGSPSLLQPSGTRLVTTTYDAVSGEVLVQSLAGYTGQDSHPEVHTTTVSLYDGSEGAAFSPGGNFDLAWEPKPQPRASRKSIDGPRTDISNETKYVYYPVDPAVPALLRGRLAAMRNAAGQIVRMETYDVFGNATRVVDANGVATETTYDALGRILTSIMKGVAGCDTAADPLCATDLTSTSSYVPPTGPLATVSRPSGAVAVYTYDDRGRIASLSRGATAGTLSERIEYDYNPTNDLKSQKRYVDVAAGNAVTRRESFSYDASNRLSLVTHDDTTTVGYSYDGSGHLLTVKDERHALPNTTNSYDAAGHLAKVTQVLSTAPGGTISTQYGYDINDNLTSVTDPNGNMTTYVFDDFGQMINQTSPVSGTSAYAYDLAGNVSSSTDANGATTSRTYDAMNRALTAVAACGTPEIPEQSETVSWIYDDSTAGRYGIGRLASMADPSGSTNFVYDRRGSLRSEERLIGTWSSSTTYQYDVDGNRAKLGDLEYVYDYAGRPLSVSRRACSTCTPVSLISSASYLPFGPETDLLFGNGTRQTKTYDTRYRITENRLTAPGTLTLADHAYVTDAGGNVTTIQDSINATYSRTFAYDDISRLITANSGSSLWGSGTYTYDRMGNMLSAQIGDRTESFTYTGTTPLIATSTEQGTGFDMTYDAAGNELFAHYSPPPAQGDDGDGDGDAGSSPGSNGTYVSRTYSCRNLMAIEFTSNLYTCNHPPCHPGLPGNVYSYTYDGRGVRVAASANGQETDYVYTPELQLLQRRNSVSSAIDEFVWFNGHAVAQLSSQTSTPVFTFTDHLGTPTVQTDSTAQIVWLADYEPYGRVYQTRTSTVDQPLRLPGQDVASQTEIDENYNIFRWYRSGWGRYTQPDPLGVAGGLNLFGYVDENPVRFFDPLGLISPVKPQNQKWRLCNAVETAQCQASCKYGMESCRVSQTFRVIRAKNGMVVRAWVDGPMSCSCKEPNCWDKVKDWAKQWSSPDPTPLPPLIPLPPFQPPPISEPVMPGLPPFFINPCLLNPSLCYGPGGPA